MDELGEEGAEELEEHGLQKHVYLPCQRVQPGPSIVSDSLVSAGTGIYEAFVFYASNADNPQWRKFIFFTSLLALMEELSAGRSVTVEDKHNLSLV